MQTVHCSHPNHHVFDPLKQVLNLFLALLLSNFGSSSLSAPTADQDTNKIAEAFNRIARFSNWIKRSVANALKYVKNKFTNQISDQPPGERTNHNSWIWNEGFYPLVLFYTIKSHFFLFPSLIQTKFEKYIKKNSSLQLFALLELQYLISKAIYSNTITK